MSSVFISHNHRDKEFLRSMLLLDRLGFVPGPNEPQEEVIRVPNVLETAISWVVEHARRKLLRLLTQHASVLRTTRASQIARAVKELSIDSVRFPVVSLVVR